MKRREILAIGGAVLSMGAGCADGDGGDTPRSGEVEISVDGMGYHPRKMAVEVGTTVTWINENETILPAHTVTSKKLFAEASEWEFDERLEEAGDTVSYTFEATGLYSYVGTIKGEDCMCGLVTVGDVSYDEALPCSSVRGGGCQ